MSKVYRTSCLFTVYLLFSTIDRWSKQAIVLAFVSAREGAVWLSVTLCWLHCYLDAVQLGSRAAQTLQLMFVYSALVQFGKFGLISDADITSASEPHCSDTRHRPDDSRAPTPTELTIATVQNHAAHATPRLHQLSFCMCLCLIWWGRSLELLWAWCMDSIARCRQI